MTHLNSIPESLRDQIPEARQILDSKMTEKQFTQQVIQLLKLCGFDHVYHTWNSMHSAKGFPDLVAIREKDKQLWFIELKSEGKFLTQEQEEWARALMEIGKKRCRWYFWRPSDWDRIVEIIKKESRVARK